MPKRKPISRPMVILIAPRKGGVNRLAKKPTIKIGIVSVTETAPKAWNLRYQDPWTGRDIRRRLKGISRSEMEKIAANVCTKAFSENGYLPGQRVSLPSVHDALAESIRLSKQRPYIRKDSTLRAALFEKWLASNFGGVKTWEQLLPAMIQSYANDLEKRGLAYDTIRNHLKPVKMAWRRMAENYPDRVHPLPRIQLTKPRSKPIDCLNPGETSILLDWLQVKVPDLWPVATLQALAGLRMLEATSLRIQDIDFEKGTIEITETRSHKPKTNSSYRIIPVCDEVLEVLREHVNQMKVITTEGDLFLTRRGNTWSAGGISLKFRRQLLKAAARLSIPRLNVVQAHRLRASFGTMAARLDLSDRLVQKYLGHTSTTILRQHYQVVGDSELDEVSSRFNSWRKLVSREDYGKILATSGNEGLEVSEIVKVKAV